MTRMPKFDSLSLQQMASGHACLNLTEQISWEAFPSFADDLMHLIGGEITNKGDRPDLRVWEVCVEGNLLRLVFDDFPVMVSMESSDDQSDKLLARLFRVLRGK